jgi:hypothetical protein
MKISRVVKVISNPGRVLRPIEEISDRAKRYRANRPEVRPSGPKQCGYCGSRRNIGVDHIDGFEEHCDRANLMYACKSCNAQKAHLFKVNGLGRRVNQLNPSRANAGVTMAQYEAAIKVMRGVFPGDVAKAIDTIRSASASMRSAYTAKTWRTWRAKYGPSGRADGAASDDVPF